MSDSGPGPFNYQGNSNKSKQPREPKIDEKRVVERVVTSEVIVKKKSIASKAKNLFFGGDFKSAMKFVAADVLLPAFRNLIWATYAEAGRRTIFGDSPYSRARSEYPNYRSTVQYNNPTRPRDIRDAYYTMGGGTNLPDQPTRFYPQSPTRSARREMNQFYIVNREEAEAVIESMINMIEKYDLVTVADLNEMLGQPIMSTDNKWGWTSIAGSQIRQTNNGYLVDLPPAEPVMNI